MNYQKIIGTFKKKGLITVYTAKDRQWISDGYAVYPLLQMPKMNEQSIRAIFDIADSVHIVEKAELPATICFDDIDVTENAIFQEEIQLQPSGLDTVSFRTQAGVTFIDSRYLDPIGGVYNDGNVGIYERVNTETGKVYIVVKRGMMLEAVISPLQVLAADWVDELTELAAAIRNTYNEEAIQR